MSHNNTAPEKPASSSAEDAIGSVGEAESLYDPRFLEALRSQMIRFARLQLRDDHQAEDAVQEALAGALKNADSFARQSALRTWVFSILKYKIADVLRYRQRVIATSELGDAERQDQVFIDGLFKANGHWHRAERPTSWSGPQGGVQSDHFWRVFDACLNGLPEKQARVFMMREFIELESREICDQLGLSTSNLHVLLYRARLRLRECLENSWFNASTSGESDHKAAAEEGERQ
ncbi:RNA polymerase factor sigma-70 [Microbulbifer sp. YPW1]|uniref:RNA polymerase factor sigma-70 n=1 Tax=Microbulbifer sp. YPW1 TaxID=2745199 RepID=UPI001598B476|nr:RNA polymerase factor sigma-70 [Microbulbifer sp. YPW1]QKX18264.1 RNA polymerase factor sigma-70 [Microbulbifer sp. YPW1]